MPNLEIKEFDELEARVAAFVAPALCQKIEDQQSLALMQTTGSMVKSLKKLLDETRDALVRPSNQYVKKVNARAKQIGAPLEHVDLHIRNEIRGHQVKLAAANLAALRAEAEKKAREESAVKAFEGQTKLTEQIFGVADPEDAQAIADERARIDQEARANEARIQANRVKGTSTVFNFTVEAEHLVPREFCTPDLQAIRAAVKSGVRSIAGVKIFEEVRVSIR